MDIIMASFNVLFFACDRSVCVRKDGEYLLLDNPGEVLCKWLVENIDESGRPITEERDFKAVVLFQSSEFMKSVCRVNGWPSLDNITMRRKLTIKICNARRGLKKTPHLETNNEVAGFR
ncbi:hypothetical protein NDU88_005220 [Pleurodeles waltl]|uniref:Uncharacterized protein n=1 Tax=Pleurodeles waltl TaxID=8319 RepID=A0AAV7TAM7_PLEWA|nr:hypothetical protein NDU88_005220 [Pleurodeles waltl]